MKNFTIFFQESYRHSVVKDSQFDNLKDAIAYCEASLKQLTFGYHAKVINSFTGKTVWENVI